MQKAAPKKAQQTTSNGVFAVSYLRFSTPEQIKGDTVRRQLQMADEWSRKNNVPINKTIRDAGVSAFRGKNALEGKLSVFLNLVNAGKVPRGTYLLVESLDRLSRDAAYKAFNLMFQIISSGIRIVSLNDDIEYSEEILENNPGALFLWLGTAIRANQESAEKSRRVREAWKAKRDRAHEGIVVTARLPGWLKATEVGKNRTVEVVPERVAVVQMIFRMAIDGYGQRRIVQHLNDNKIPPFRSRKWGRSNLIRVLTSRAVLGEFQSYATDRDGNRTAQGDLIPNYFPRVISDEDFNLAAAATFSRRGASGRRGPRMVNLLQGMVYCGSCGDRMSHINKGAPPKGARYYMCSSFERRAGCENPTSWRADAIENAVLDRGYKVDWSDFDASAAGSVAVMLEMKRGELAKLDEEIANLMNAIRAGVAGAIDAAKADQQKQQRVIGEVAALEAELARQSSVPTPEKHEAIIAELRGRLSDADPETAADLRTKISQTLKWSIERIRFWGHEVAVIYRTEVQRGFRKHPPTHHVIMRSAQENERFAREREEAEEVFAAEQAALGPVKLPFRSARKL